MIVAVSAVSLLLSSTFLQRVEEPVNWLQRVQVQTELCPDLEESSRKTVNWERWQRLVNVHRYSRILRQKHKLLNNGMTKCQTEEFKHNFEADQELLQLLDDERSGLQPFATQLLQRTGEMVQQTIFNFLHGDLGVCSRLAVCRLSHFGCGFGCQVCFNCRSVHALED